MAVTALLDRLGWVVKAGDPMAGNPTQQIRIVMILAAQPFVAVDLLGQMNLVTHRAELSGFMEGF